ncbi:MAG: hypothetical protein AAB583_05760 [Patescibacteria group bacterium]
MVLERGLRMARVHPDNQDPVKLRAIQVAEDLLLGAGVTDPQDGVLAPMIEANETQELILDLPLYRYYPDRGGVLVRKKDKRIVDLSLRENIVLEMLARKAALKAVGKADGIGRSEEFVPVFGEVWVDDILKHNIKNLRHRLGDEKVGGEFSAIQTVFNVGYVLLAVPYIEHDKTKLQPEATIYESGQDHVGQTQESNKEFVYIHSSGFVYNRERGSVIVDGKETFLGFVQKMLLEAFIRNENKIISGEKLIQGTGLKEKNPLSIKTQVKILRRTLKDKMPEGENNFTIIRYAHKRGYILVEPERL